LVAFAVRCLNVYGSHKVLYYLPDFRPQHPPPAINRWQSTLCCRCSQYQPFVNFAGQLFAVAGTYLHGYGSHQVLYYKLQVVKCAGQLFAIAGTYLEVDGSHKVLYYQWQIVTGAGQLVVFAGTYLDGDGSHKVLYYLPVVFPQCSVMIQFHLLISLLFSEDRVFGQSSTCRASAQAGPPWKACQGRRHRAVLV